MPSSATTQNPPFALPLRQMLPAFCVTFEADITRFLRYVRQNRFSFTLSLVHASAKCANEIEEFRYRFSDGNIVLFDQIDTAFTWLDRQTELFKVVRVPFLTSLREYVAIAKETAEKQREYFTGPLGNDVFQFSPLPWLSYTHISHTVSGKRDAATPLFDWGQYRECGGKILLPYTVQVHHSFADGLHVAKFAQKLQTALDTPGD